MNQKELNEIRRRFRLDKNNFSRIFGCYVNSNREVISWIDASLGLMRQEKQEMYLGLLKKTLSGALNTVKLRNIKGENFGFLPLRFSAYNITTGGTQLYKNNIFVTLS